MELKILKNKKRTLDIKIVPNFVDNLKPIYPNIELMNLDLKLDGGRISASDYEKMKKQYSELLRLLDRNNSDKYGYPYTLGFMETYGYYNTGYDQNDPFDLWKKLKDLQEYVFEKRNELRGE